MTRANSQHAGNIVDLLLADSRPLRGLLPPPDDSSDLRWGCYWLSRDGKFYQADQPVSSGHEEFAKKHIGAAGSEDAIERGWIRWVQRDGRAWGDGGEPTNAQWRAMRNAAIETECDEATYEITAGGKRTERDLLTG
jgi:hypothetical protein